jgi:SpoVK/Ycf46/Vps4 family AAA+-type ATPase
LIAEQEKRPLLRISSGDLGQYSWDADNKLQALLKLALKCYAIVLIDEAEVFLAKRTSDSADSYRRNSLVSVFLNQLEYFQGVMFLTTNRDTDIDEAIDSRIHIRLQYDALGTNDRARIWETQLKKDKFPLDWNRQVFNDLGREYEINGREIQNLAHIAKRLSLQRKEPLTLGTIKAIYAMRQKLTSNNVES